MINAILACDVNGGIGKNGMLPWEKSPSDLKRFQKTTKNQIVIMGRHTWESLDMPCPLPNRMNVVVSSKPLIVQPDIWINTNESSILKSIVNIGLDAVELKKSVWIIGGAALFDTCFPLINKILLTKFNNSYDCDTFIDLAKINQEFNSQGFIQTQTHTFHTLSRKEE